MDHLHCLTNTYYSREVEKKSLLMMTTSSLFFEVLVLEPKQTRQRSVVAYQVRFFPRFMIRCSLLGYERLRLSRTFVC